MIVPDRTEWQVRCAFNAFCKRVLKNEAINSYNDKRKQQAKEMAFSDLTPQEENQLYTFPKLLAEVMRTLPKEKRKTVLLKVITLPSRTSRSSLANIKFKPFHYHLNYFWSLRNISTCINFNQMIHCLNGYPLKALNRLTNHL